MENIKEFEKHPAPVDSKKLGKLRRFRGALGDFDEDTIWWAIEEAEEL